MNFLAFFLLLAFFSVACVVSSFFIFLFLLIIISIIIEASPTWKLFLPIREKLLLPSSSLYGSVWVCGYWKYENNKNYVKFYFFLSLFSSLLKVEVPRNFTHKKTTTTRPPKRACKYINNEIASFFFFFLSLFCIHSFIRSGHSSVVLSIPLTVSTSSLRCASLQYTNLFFFFAFFISPPHPFLQAIYDFWRKLYAEKDTFFIFFLLLLLK